MTTTELDPSFEELLEFVKDSRGVDYRAYKRPTLMRRFAKRMQATGVETYADYRDYLEAEPREFSALFDAILVNMTGFFRDPPAWNYLRTRVLPSLLEGKANDEAVRVWSAGCSSGEEAYTAGMLLASALGEDEYRRRVKIYATDVDEDVLSEGRHGRYGTKALEAVPEELRARFFQRADGDFAISGDLRRSVIFERNDLLSDPPISRVDLLVSRNTLMHFSPEAQMRVLSNFFFALNRNGYVFFGKAETFQTRTRLFRALDRRQRVFVKSPPAAPEPRAALAAVPGTIDAAEERESDGLRDVGFHDSPIAQLVVDANGTLMLANQHARSLFRLGGDAVGRPLQDLELSYRPVELRSRIDKALAEGRRVSVRGAVWSDTEGDRRHLDVQVSPLIGAGGEVIGTTVAFFDVSLAEALREELETAKRELEAAYEELQSTVEELERTNEELETTNEELQSTNEELETMNEELETIDDEPRGRTGEAMGANAFLRAILASVHQGVVVLDADLRVLAWSEAAVDLWGLRADEVVGRHFLDLDIGLPDAELRRAIRQALLTDAPHEVKVEARDRRGQPVLCAVSFARLTAPAGQVDGVILVMTAERRDERA